MALEYEPDSKRLTVAHKGLSAVEHYLVVRHFMYAQVYNHPKNISITWLLEQAFNRARVLLEQGKLQADETVTAWLRAPQQPLSTAAYLAGDDIVFTYHLQRWQHSDDPLLADLCRRFLDRDLLKTLEVTRLSAQCQTALLEEVCQYLEDQGDGGRHYCTLRHIWSKGYTTYQQGIELYSDNIFVDIRHISPIVQTLSQSYERIWLLYPREIQSWLQQRWQVYSTGLAVR
jgi:HD superfamily phosphohydrolase